MSGVHRIRAGGVLLLCAAVSTAAYSQDVFIDDGQSPIQVLGFGDMSYLSSDGQTTEGFFIGQAVAHIVAPISDRLTLFSEISGTARDSEYHFDIERLFISYDFNNEYSLSAGRFHTPIGYWNTAYHHGAWLQTSAQRPQMVKFGTPLVPIHFVGVHFSSRPQLGRGDLSYTIDLGNGRHENIGRPGDAGDINGNRAWSAAVNYEFDGVDGLNVGGGIYSDSINPALGPETDEEIFSAYFVLEQESPEIIAEYFRIEHDTAVGPSISSDTDAYYAQFAYRLRGNRSAYKPYVRAERVDVADNSPLLSGLGLDYEGIIVGVRYDFAPTASLKFEYHNEEFGNMGKENNFLVQVNFVIARN